MSALTYVPFAPDQLHLAAYFDRLMARASVARTVDAARPYFRFYPGRAGMDPRFFVPESV